MNPSSNRHDFTNLDRWAPALLATVLAFAFGLICWGVQSCAQLKTAYGTPENRKAIGQALLKDAGGILESAAVNALANATQQAVSDGNVDFAHAAAAGLYAQVSAANVRQVVLDATGGSLPHLADTAAKVVTAQIANGTGEQAALTAAANAISGTALTATK